MATITLAEANTYFGRNNHLRAGQWGAIESAMRTAALAHAKRVVSREIGEDVDDEMADADADAYYQPDYAVYEQALYMVVNSYVVANGEESGPHYLGTDPDEPDAVKKADPDELCAEAARWLQRPRRQFILRRG